MIENYGLNINRFEEVLQKLTSNIADIVVFEKLPPSELWDRSEADVTSLRSLAEQLREAMLTLKPEKAPTIMKRSQAVLQPLDDFKEALFRKSDDPLADSRLALESLRKAVTEGSVFLSLAKEIREKPSEGILEVLRLKEIYEAKDYLSTVAVPEVVYARLTSLRKSVKDFKDRISDLEQIISELKKSLERVYEEASKYRPFHAEPSSEDEERSESNLASEDENNR